VPSAISVMAAPTGAEARAATSASGWRQISAAALAAAIAA